MRSGFLLLCFAASFCALEATNVKASFQEKAATPFFRSARRVFADGQIGDKASPVTKSVLSQAGALGTVFKTGSFGFLGAASSAAYLLLNHFVALKNNGVDAQARELSGEGEDFMTKAKAKTRLANIKEKLSELETLLRTIDKTILKDPVVFVNVVIAIERMLEEPKMERIDKALAAIDDTQPLQNLLKNPQLKPLKKILKALNNDLTELKKS